MLGIVGHNSQQSPTTVRNHLHRAKAFITPVAATHLLPRKVRLRPWLDIHLFQMRTLLWLIMHLSAWLR